MATVESTLRPSHGAAHRQALPLPMTKSTQETKGRVRERESKVNTAVNPNLAKDDIRQARPSGSNLNPGDLKLPVPILVMGLMKAGTTSVYGYFKCGLDPAVAKLSHYDCQPGESGDFEKIGMACGKRMRRNLTKYHKPAFFTFDRFHLYAELDAQELKGGMTLPQWSYLEAIYAQFPNATWILNWREPAQWLQSVDRWRDLRQRFIDNPFSPDLPKGKGEDDADMIHFYVAQAQRIRDFVQSHPSLSFVELPIDSPDAGQIIEDAFGITRACWGNRNVNNGTAIWTGL
jgi:hypothetical protein